MARLARNPLEPCADCRKGSKIESAVRRAVCVGIERNVRDRGTPAREPAAPCKGSLHPAESGIALRMPFGDQMSPLLEFLFRCKRKPEAGHRNIGFMTVLLEKHPLQHLGAAPPIDGQQGRILAQVPEDCIRLREAASILELEQRNAAIWILGEKIRLARVSVMKPVILECEIYAELSRGESDFVAIAGHLHLMKHGHVKSPPSVKKSMATGCVLHERHLMGLKKQTR